MRTLLSSVLFLMLATPAMAEPNLVPEPQSLGLVAAGLVAAIWIARRKKK